MGDLERERPVAQQMLPPRLEWLFERLAHDQRAETGAIDDEFDREFARPFELERSDEATLVAVDVDHIIDHMLHPALDSDHPEE